MFKDALMITTAPWWREQRAESMATYIRHGRHTFFTACMVSSYIPIVIFLITAVNGANITDGLRRSGGVRVGYYRHHAGHFASRERQRALLADHLDVMFI
jgi:hypothetical protein